MFSHLVCVHAYVRASAAVPMHGLYADVQTTTTFNYVCEWIWEKVNCSVKLGNWLFDVWGLITWHFYYSTRSKGWREEEDEQRRRRRGQTRWRHTSRGSDSPCKVSVWWVFKLPDETIHRADLSGGLKVHEYGWELIRSYWFQFHYRYCLLIQFFRNSQGEGIKKYRSVWSVCINCLLYLNFPSVDTFRLWTKTSLFLIKYHRKSR